MPENNRATLIVDSHCHLHDINNLEQLLDHALSQFKAAASKHDITGGWHGMLIMTDGAKSTIFSHIQYMVQTKQDSTLTLDHWQIIQAEEKASLVAENKFGQKIILCAGQQIITKENLEVLSICEITRIPDGKPLTGTIEEIIFQNGLPVLPWGVGKWLGKRGKLVTETLLKKGDAPLFVGDNSGRPSFWSSVPQFKVAEQQDIPVLQGTDPLPLKKQDKWGGDYGFILSGDFSLSAPADSLKKLLTKPGVSLQNYGALESPVGFIKEQLKLRLKK